MRPGGQVTIVVAFPGWLNFGSENCPGCEITEDLGRHLEADAVIFHIPTTPALPFQKSAGQKWVAWSAESEVHYPLLADADFMRQFDLTATYRRDADVVLGHFAHEEWLPFEPPPLQSAREDAPAVYITSSPVDRSGRTEYVRELMRHLPVDSFGQSLNNRLLAGDRGRGTKLDTIARYRFTLAFENSIAPDYVTEKFYDPLLVGSVPVYLGAPNVAEHAPGADSYIDVSEFGGPAALARHLLRVAADEDEYGSYLAWRSRPLDPRFVALAQAQREPPLCRLCRLVASSAQRF
jgi:Glycosyltransferase family 10 (fucosyltransferase) C-term/Fucosyltransferase, N-terminal